MIFEVTIWNGLLIPLVKVVRRKSLAFLPKFFKAYNIHILSRGNEKNIIKKKDFRFEFLDCIIAII